MWFIRTAAWETDWRSTWIVLCWITKWKKVYKGKKHKVTVSYMSCMLRIIIGAARRVFTKQGLVEIWNDCIATKGKNLETTRLQIADTIAKAVDSLGFCIVYREFTSQCCRDLSETRSSVASGSILCTWTTITPLWFQSFTRSLF